MRNSAGYEAPHMLGAHLTRPTTPGSSRPPRATISRRGAKPRCRSRLPALICSSYATAGPRRFCVWDPRTRRHRRPRSRGWHANSPASRTVNLFAADCFLQRSEASPPSVPRDREVSCRATHENIDENIADFSGKQPGL